MYKKLFTKITLPALFLICLNHGYAQVTVENTGVTAFDIYSRPPQYDSTKNFPFPINFNPYNNSGTTFYGKDSNLYNGFVGLHLYLPPHVQVAGDANYKIVEVYYIRAFFKKHPEMASQNNWKFPMLQFTNVKHLRPHPVVFAPYDDYYSNNELELSTKPYQFYHTFKCFTDSGAVVNYLFLLRNDKTGDTIYYSPDHGRYGDVHAIMIPYFLKQKAMYEGQTLTYERGSGPSGSFYDAKTGEMLVMKKGRKWKCEQVTVLRQREVSLAQSDKRIRDNPKIKPNTFYDQYFLNYVLTSGDNEIVVSAEPVVGSDLTATGIRNLTATDISKFLTDEQYQESLMEKEQLEAAKNAKLEEYKQECIKKYGAKYGALIADHRVDIGMPMKLCEASWGEPFEVITSVNETKYDAAWLYGYKTFLYFRNGSLVLIEN